MATASPAPTSATAIISISASVSGPRVPARTNSATSWTICSRPSRTVCANAWELVAWVYITIHDARLASI
ncbi:Uncharacterised protein [Mycobacterium tuberculosis]|uniref:Uncharacterized protein n=1 Tax=Mycobacterium tuberculosis TaxID=1773 RepID=A0A654U6T5_MYCTX|nr:Uncharacterised protein [Mycobacterium tuberculosis]CKS28964.1 Uncharacterised protein [Mycobacterium tuberculosis]